MEKEVVSKNFIEQIIEKDLAEGKYETICTRFPAGTQRISAYWACKINSAELWTFSGISWEI